MLSILKFQKIVKFYDRLIDLASKYFTDLILLLMRVYVASIFFQSGWNKLANVWKGGWFKTVFLFKAVHPVPGLSAEVAAILGTGTEVLFSIMLAIGVFGRIGALGLLGVTAVITFGVHSHFTHVFWGLLLGASFIFGPGKFSVDAWLRYQWELLLKTAEAVEPEPEVKKAPRVKKSAKPKVRITLDGRKEPVA